MRKLRKQKSSFKKTLAFCIIVAIIATIIHLNGAKADTTTTVDADVNITKVDKIIYGPEETKVIFKKDKFFYKSFVTQNL